MHSENRKCVIEEDVGQIILVHCNNITVTGLDISSVTVGIQLIMSDNCQIIKNTLTDNLYGIWVLGSFNNVISENNISESKYHGISLISCFDSIISNNNLRRNNLHYYEMDLFYFFLSVNTSASIYLKTSFNNTITGNTIDSNNYNGISLILSGKNRIADNSIISNNDTGVLLAGSILNDIEKNTFMGNKKDAYIHTSIINKWKNNYWSEARKLPKLIQGTIGRRIKWFNIDWQPAQEPYEK